MAEEQKIISEKSLIPLSLLFIVMTAVSGITLVYAQVQADKQELLNLRKQQDDYARVVISIDKRLSRIEGSLGVKSGQ